MEIPTTATPFDSKPTKSNMIGIHGKLIVAARSLETLNVFDQIVAPLFESILKVKSQSPVALKVSKAIEKSLVRSARLSVKLSAWRLPFDDQLLKELEQSKDRGCRHIAEKLQAARRLASNIDSPLGVLNLYRQHVFMQDPFAGPIEHAFTVGPSETVEVRMETVQRQTFEQSQQQSLTQQDESSAEDRRSSDVSDRIARTISRSTNSTISASVSGSYGVVSGGVSGSQSWSSSDSESRERVSRQLTETVNRVSESLTRSFTVSSKTTTDFLETNSYRRTVENKLPEAINYGLRRLFQRMKIKQQSLGPRLVWQIVLENPGGSVARGALVNRTVLEGNPSKLVGPPPVFVSSPWGLQWNGPGGGTMREALERFPLHEGAFNWRVQGLKDIAAFYFANGSQTQDITFTGGDSSWTTRATIKSISETYQQKSSVSGQSTQTESISDGDAKFDATAVPNRIIVILIEFKTVGYTGNKSYSPDYETEFKPRMVEELRVATASTRFWDSSGTDGGNAEASRILGGWATYLTDVSGTLRRAPDDLRREERAIILSRVFRDKLKITPEAAGELDAFRELFDLDQFFTTPAATEENLGHTLPSTYFFDAKSSARFGSSLSWDIQPDVDDARNQFVNSAHLQAFIPIRVGRERAAVEYLRLHGQLGIPFEEELEKVLLEFAARRSEEERFPLQGPDDVFSEGSTSKRNGMSLADVYPIYREFEATAPIEGFVYQKIELK